MTIKISPTGDTSAFRLEIFEWSIKEQKDICMGDFYISAKNGELQIEGMQDWRTYTRSKIEGHYFLNEPKFHREIIEPLQGFFIKQVSDNKKENKPE